MTTMTTTTATSTTGTAPVGTAPAGQIDERRVDAFVEQLLTDFSGAAGTAMTVLGDRLGLYAAMTDAGPLTATGLAAATGLRERLVAEWLAGQTVSGYVRHDPQAGTFELPAEHALALSVVDSPACAVSAAEIIAAQYLTLAQLERVFRGEADLDYDELPRSLFEGVERFFRTAYTHELATTWFPAVDGLVPRLETGARVADVGCGHGLSTLQIAARWPASTVTGFDLHRPSVLVARAKAVEARAENVAFHVSDAAGVGPGPFDVVVFSDSLHDMGDPPAALTRAREVLVDGGIVVVVEPWSLDGLTEGIGNSSVRIDYAISTSVCTPTALAQHGGHAIGTQGGPTLRLRLLAEAGFRDPVLAADTGANLVLAATG
jgi:SAM-dependent methyltransferase